MVLPPFGGRLFFSAIISMTHGPFEKAITTLLGIVALLAILVASFFLFSAKEEFIDPALQGDAEFSIYSHEEARPVAPDLAEEPLAESDWSEFVREEGWEVLEPVPEQEQKEVQSVESALAEPEIDQPRVGQSASSTRKRGDSTLVVITNFTRATVTVNDEIYPTYSDDGQNRGLRLPSGQEHEVRVQFGESEKLYRVRLTPGERRLLMVELTGMRPGGAAPATPRPEPRRRTEAVEEEPVGDGQGQITVYSRPRGSILVAGRDTGEQTPGSVDIEEGRHEVQVRYEDGEVSETKVVRVREGSRIKLFFRQND